MAKIRVNNPATYEQSIKDYQNYSDARKEYKKKLKKEGLLSNDSYADHNMILHSGFVDNDDFVDTLYKRIDRALVDSASRPHNYRPTKKGDRWDEVLKDESVTADTPEKAKRYENKQIGKAMQADDEYLKRMKRRKDKTSLRISGGKKKK